MTDQNQAMHQRRKALILGLGASGIACARHLAARGVVLSVADTRLSPPFADALFQLCPEAEFVTGSLPSKLDPAVNMLVVSPGLSLYNGPSGELVRQARERGVPVVGEIELFALELERLAREEDYHPRVVAVTGTNGKTTTVTLLHTLLTAAGHEAALAGNVGPNVLDVLASASSRKALPEVWVLELSSFQLASTSTLAPDAAALLNITEDHVDWHGSMQAYALDKARVFRHARHGVVNRDDEGTARLLAATAIPAGPTFGSDEPVRTGDWGLVPDASGRTLLVRASGDGPVAFVHEDDLQLAGRHNTLNVLAVLSLLDTLGVPLESVRKALLGYKGEPHRVQPLFESGGVLFIDDSKGTNVGAVVAAVKGVFERGRRVLIVMGGDGKGQDFTPLKEALAGRSGGVALIGRDAPAIERALEGLDAPVKRFDGMAGAVTWLWSLASSGDAVLLSPACASWDMYRNYAERSEDFTRCARTVTKID